ncbi:MAG: hypothetical protein AAB019_06505 [Planctomycetota bacterium]
MSMDKAIPVILILLAVSLVSSFLIGLVGYTSIQSLGRNPSRASRAQLRMAIYYMIIGAAAVAIFLIVFKWFKPT